jgi:hypothetical protein
VFFCWRWRAGDRNIAGAINMMGPEYAGFPIAGAGVISF